MDDFIEVYPDAIDPETCRRIIERFEASGQAVRGSTGGGVDVTLKNSYDITISDYPEWRPVEAAIITASFAGLRQYVRKYPFVLIGALDLQFEDPATGARTRIVAENVAAVPDEQFRHMLGTVFRPGTVNLQKYLAGRGGYQHWHSEIFPRPGTVEPLHRVLLYTIYLNDVPRAGETEFYYQRRTIVPRAGSLLIAPAGFTHTHRGNTPDGGDKYIATSWIQFQRAEALYGG